MKINEIITETTSAGSIATVVAGQGPMITRNASIYGNTDKEKKKQPKTGKYKNSIK